MIRSRRGFTLIEVLVAMSILAGGIVILANAWSGNLMRVRKARLYNNVASLLERKMTELEVKYKDAAIGEIPPEETGDFGSEYPQYRWTFKTQEFNMPDLSGAMISQEGGADDTLLSMIRQTSDFMSQSVKEAKLSIFVKAGQREIEYSVTTYFVDYNQEFVPGGG